LQAPQTRSSQKSFSRTKANFGEKVSMVKTILRYNLSSSF
jgi:hypothetical protein